MERNRRTLVYITRLVHRISTQIPLKALSTSCVSGLLISLLHLDFLLSLLAEPEPDPTGIADTRLLSLLLSLAFVLVVMLGAARGGGMEDRPMFDRTGCGTKSDLWRALPDSEWTTSFNSASGSAGTTQSEVESAASGVTSGSIGATESLSASCETRVEQVESGDSGRSSMRVVGTWKET